MLDVEVLDDARAASAVLDPVRRDVLTALRRPGSAASLASSLGMTRQRVRYHLTQLELHGLIEPVGERVWGGITERVVVARARSFVISVDALGELAADPAEVGDRLSARYLVALAARSVREVGLLLRRADTQHKKLATLSADTTIRFGSAAERAQFADELAAVMRGLAARYNRPRSRRGRDHRLVLLCHPTGDGA